MGWHADDEPELGPLIASLSFGAKRCLAFRKRGESQTAFKVALESGSLLLMSANLQEDWQHSLPKSLRIKEARLNLTFRSIIPR